MIYLKVIKKGEFILMAMNFNQMLKFQQMKNSLKRFDRDHPKFKNFLNAVTREQALREGAVIELSVTSSEGKNYCSNIKLNAEDIELINQLKTMNPNNWIWNHLSNLDGYMPDQSFHVGDKITHNVFGNGRIKSILSDRNAYLIKFDQMETPRMISFRVPIKKIWFHNIWLFHFYDMWWNRSNFRNLYTKRIPYF